MPRRDLLPVVQKALSDVYTVEREIGRGGAAHVYLATRADGSRVALKVLRPELSVSVTADRFLREIAFVSTLDHPHICRLIDSGERDWLVYYAMPFVEGPSLTEYLRKYKTCPLIDTLRMAHALLDALHHAHGQGIVHRDVKPDNIVLARTGPVLLDFGIGRAIAIAGTTRLTRSGITVGTAHYMSPEQIAGETNIDGRTDVYSLGCVLYESLAGHPPFQTRSEGRVLHDHLATPPPDLRGEVPSLTEQVSTAVMRALEKQPSARWTDARAMQEALPKPGDPS